MARFSMPAAGEQEDLDEHHHEQPDEAHEQDAAEARQVPLGDAAVDGRPAKIADAPRNAVTTPDGR